MAEFNVIKECRYGKLIFNKNDMYIGKSLELYGEYSEGEIDLFRQIVHQGDTVLEVGANLGAHTLALAQLVGEGGRVHAFEPQRLVFQTLAGNLALNSVTNVFAYQKAVGEAPGCIMVPVLDYRQEVNWGGLELGGWEQGEEVEQITVDSLSLTACHFIKVDVEGMELSVLKGAAQTIRRFEPLLYVENDRADKSQALIDYLDELGYDLYWHKPPLYSESNYFGNKEDVFRQKRRDENGREVFLSVVSVNMLCLPRSRQINAQGFEKIIVGRKSAKQQPAKRRAEAKGGKAVCNRKSSPTA